MRKDTERLRDILEAVEAIERYTADGRERFDDEELVRVWCLRHIEIIGEAASRLSEEFRVSHPEIPWREIIATRNALIHGYFDIDWEAVWIVVAREIAGLKAAIQGILTSPDNS